jgi:uncharacterized protein YacL
LSDLEYAGTNATDTRDHYLRTIESLELVLRQSLAESNWIERLQTPGYWVIRDMPLDSGRPLPLIESECKRLERWILDFENELERVAQEDSDNLVSTRLVLDTSAIVRHKSFSEIDWLSHSDSSSVRLIIPLLVLRQLDDLKDSGKSDKARPRLRTIRKLLEDRGRGPVPLQRPKTSLELLMDPPRHTRLSIPDEEIISRARYLQGRPGGPVVLVTGDYTMEVTAQAHGLPVLFLPEEMLVGSVDD